MSEKEFMEMVEWYYTMGTIDAIISSESSDKPGFSAEIEYWYEDNSGGREHVHDYYCDMSQFRNDLDALYAAMERQDQNG